MTVSYSHVLDACSCHSSGFWAVQNFVRPLRISLALALAPAFDKAITQLGERLNIPKGW